MDHDRCLYGAKKEWELRELLKMRSGTVQATAFLLVLATFFIVSFLYAAEENQTFLPIINKPTGFFEGPEEAEPNNTFGQANGPLRPDINYIAYPNDANDLFSFLVPKTGKITVDIKNHDVDGGQARLYHVVNGKPVPVGGLSFVPPDYHIEIPNAEPGKYYLFVFVDTSKGHRSSSAYTIKINFPSGITPTTTPIPGNTPTATLAPGTTPTVTATNFPGATSTPTGTLVASPTPTATRAEGTIGFDDVISSSITNGLERKEFSFQATAGDKVYVRVLSTSGELEPLFIVRRPNGEDFCSAYTFDVLAETVCTIDTNGTHKVLVGDRSTENIGAFNLYIQGTNNPSNSVTILSDELKNDVIDPPVDLDAFSFNATAGDRYMIKVLNTSGEFQPLFRVYRPSGTEVCNTYTFDKIAEELCPIDSNGTHTILVGDRTGVFGGTFDVTIQQTNNPTNISPISFDDIVLGKIEPAIDLDSYKFNANAGDRILIRTLTTSGQLEPRFFIYRPSGTQVCATYTFDVLAEVLCAIDTNGEHTILLGDRTSNNVGDYNVYVQRANDPANTQALLFNEVKSDTINPSVDIDAYSFTANAGQKVTVRMQSTSGELEPLFRVYRPNGTELCSAYSFNVLAERQCTIDSNGTHNILVSDHTGEKTGNYNVLVQ